MRRRIATSESATSTLAPSVLVDAGPLVALIDTSDPNHARATSTLKTLPRAPLLAVWPGFTEAMYLLGREGGYPAQANLLNFIQAGAVQLWNPASTQIDFLTDRIAELMAVYRDTPCDLADATLVAVAEIENLSRVFTFDRHFYAYRTIANKALDVVSTAIENGII